MEELQPEYQDEFEAPPGDAVYNQSVSSITEPQADDLQDPLHDAFGDVQPETAHESSTQETTQLAQKTETSVDESQENVEKPAGSDPVPLPEYEALQQRLEKNRFDPTSWNRLIHLAEESGDIEKIKQAYETLLSAYPNIVRLFLFFTLRASLSCLTLACGI